MSDTRNLNPNALGDLYEALTEAREIVATVDRRVSSLHANLKLIDAALRKARGEG